MDRSVGQKSRQVTVEKKVSSEKIPQVTVFPFATSIKCSWLDKDPFRTAHVRVRTSWSRLFYSPKVIVQVIVWLQQREATLISSHQTLFTTTDRAPHLRLSYRTKRSQPALRATTDESWRIQKDDRERKMEKTARETERERWDSELEPDVWVVLTKPEMRGEKQDNGCSQQKLHWQKAAAGLNVTLTRWGHPPQAQFIRIGCVLVLPHVVYVGRGEGELRM